MNVVEDEISSIEKKIESEKDEIERLMNIVDDYYDNSRDLSDKKGIKCLLIFVLLSIETYLVANGKVNDKEKVALSILSLFVAEKGLEKIFIPGVSISKLKKQINSCDLDSIYLEIENKRNDLTVLEYSRDVLVNKGPYIRSR